MISAAASRCGTSLAVISIEYLSSNPGAPSARTDACIEGQAGLAAYTLHQPPAGTLCPAKMLQPAVASDGLPWYCAQLLHFCEGLNVGLAAASTLLASVTKPSALAVGSFGSSGVSAAASAVVPIKPNADPKAPARRPLLTIDRRVILLCIGKILVVESVGYFPAFRESMVNK